MKSKMDERVFDASVKIGGNVVFKHFMRLEESSVVMYSIKGNFPAEVESAKLLDVGDGCGGTDENNIDITITRIK